MSELGGEPWYVAAFGADYRTVYPHRDLESARREVEGLLAFAPLSGRVLDLCCGFGRHTLALAERGVDVFGVDLSPDLLAQSARLAGGVRLRGRLVRGDARSVPFRDGAFEGLVILFSSFGYFGDEGDARVLDEVARLLAAGGLAVLDLMNPDRVRSGLVPRSERAVGAGRLLEERSLLDGGRRVAKEVTLELPGRGARRWREEVRMYEREEIAAQAARRGLAVVDARGDFAGEPFGSGSERQILLLRREGPSG